jgi:hypothetical protein
MRSIAASRAAGSALAALLLAGTAAAAPTFTVNSTIDAPGADTMGSSLSDGVCETQHGNGICTLRAAIMEANHVPGGGATILLPAGRYSLTIGPSPADGEESGDLNALAPVTVIGDGPSASIIDGSRIDRVLHTAAQSVMVEGLTIQNGRPLVGSGGGILNDGELALENVMVSGSQSDGGAGIYNSGTLTISNCILDGNQTGDAGGGVANALGATIHIADSLISGNVASSGGGVSNLGDATIERTTFIGNRSNTYSSENGFGGGAVYSAGNLAMINDTLDSNSAHQLGGGLYVASGSTELINLTITRNHAVGAQGVAGLGGGIVGSPQFVLLKNSIVAGNDSTNASAVVEPDECPAPILSGDYNLIGARSTCTLTGVVDHVNATDEDPGLDPLALNGGFGPDRRSTTFGPTTEAIPPASCIDQFGAPLAVDGRGYARTGSCDIGADQLLGAYAPSPLLGVELIRNGGAAGNELGLATADSTSSADPPYWIQPIGGMTQVLYGAPGGFPSRSDAPAGSGSYFFAGGANAPTFTSSSQRIDVSSLAAQIDAGQIGFRAAGSFGGFSTEDDNATLIVSLEDGALTPIQTVTLGGFTAADRGNATKLMPDAKTGGVPVGTRLIEVVLTATRVDTGGPYNDGYADDLSLVLPEPYSPVEGGLALAAVAALALQGAPRTHCRRPPRLR